MAGRERGLLCPDCRRQMEFIKESGGATFWGCGACDVVCMQDPRGAIDRVEDVTFKEYRRGDVQIVFAPLPVVSPPQLLFVAAAYTDPN